MIEKFNFYDLYAYFLPGVILLALMLIPFALTVPFSSSFQSGIFALVLSYVFGYLVQSVARVLFPSKVRKEGKERYPSQILLDADDRGLSSDLKTMVGKFINQQFGLQVIEGGDVATIDRARNDAFRLCRTYLLQESKKSYAEQLQGMYAFFRGASTACLLGLPAYMSVAVYALVGPRIVWLPISAALWLCFFLLIQSRFHYGEDPVPRTEKHGFWRRAWTRLSDQWYFWLLSAVALVLGSFFDVLALSRSHHVSDGKVILATIVMVLILGSTASVFAASSRSMMWDFAATVYRDYAALSQKVFKTQDAQ
ncbi:MAG: hypothetical protein ABSE25_11165 [Syntrophorhabdales bacterium]|jgi:hypothetical protein